MDVPIEREPELAAIDAVIAAAVSGGGGAVLIEGEAGIGKTRLLEAARAHATAAGARVLHATADEADASVPLSGARELLARAARGVTPDGPARIGVLALDGALAESTGPGSRADEVVHALWWLIVELAEQQPLTLLVDDAQWADDLTLRLLRMAARRALDVPLALVVAIRPAAPGRRHAMLAAERSFALLQPAALSVAGTGRLLSEALGRPQPDELAAQARTVTGGNPLYLSELAHQAQADGTDVLAGSRPPPQLVRLIGDRLERLTPAAAALARAIAVLGSDTETRRAARLAEVEPEHAIAAREELRDERLLDAAQDAFTHPLVADAVRAGIGATQLSTLHAAAAALLADDGASDERIAEHLILAPPRGDPRAVATLRTAAEAARRLGAPATAARLLERALAEPPDPELVDAIDFECGRAQLDAGSENGAAVLTRLVQRTGELPARADAARHLGRYLALDGRGEEAVAVLTTAVEALDDSHRELRLELLAEAALVGASVRGGREAALRMVAADASLVTGKTPSERLLLVAAQVVAGDVPGDPAVAARRVLELRLHRDFPGGYAASELTFGATALLVNADDIDDAEQAMETLRTDAEALALPHAIAGALLQQAQLAYQRGDLARCEVESRAAIEAGGGHVLRLATPWRVMTLSEQGRLDEAERLLAEAGMLGAIGPSALLNAVVGSRGRLRLAQNDLAAAIEDLADACDRSAAWLAQRVEPPWQPLLAEALVLAGRGEEAAAVTEAYTSHAAYWGTRRALGHAARMRALNAPRAQAIALLEDAREHFAAAGAQLELARSLSELGARQRAAGERREARATLRDAHDTAHACRASALCDSARAELLLAGGRPRPPAGAGAHALTPGERRVAEIAAAGASNREIARRLYLSPKTVEMHLRSAYRKLDLAGREGLAGALS